jgi:hypothetical protein
MPQFDELLAAARQLPAVERERLARELLPPSTLTPLGALLQRSPAPQTAAWLKAEEGHAVLATGGREAVSQGIPAGAPALEGIWGDLREKTP